MAEENFEPLLRELKAEPGSHSDLVEKLKKVFRRLKSKLQKEPVVSYKLSNIIYDIMKEEEVTDVSYINSEPLVDPVKDYFKEKFKPSIERGIDERYYFFDGAELSDYAKKDIALYKELSAKVDEYAKGRKVDPKDFKEFVYSILSPVENNCDKHSFYGDMRRKYHVEEFKIKEKSPIELALEDIDPDDI